MWMALALVACRDTPDSGPSGHREDTGETAGETGETAGETGETGLSVDVPPGALILDHVRVVDAVTVRESAAVIIVGDEIWAVTDAGRAWPSDAEVVDRSGQTVIPGLIDAHVHLWHSGSMWWVGPSLGDNLRAQLAWGVLGVADLAAPVEIFEVRDRIAEGTLLGPRIWATGPFLTAEGSHPCETTYDEKLCVFVDGDGAEAVAALSRADGIKVALADADFTAWPTTRLDVGDLAEIVDAAAAADQPVFAHVDEPSDASDAVEAGVAVLAHPVFSTDATSLQDAPVMTTVGAFANLGALVRGELLEEDLSYTPDAVVAAWAWLAEHPEDFLTGWVDSNADWAEHARANLVLAREEGRTVIAGTDAGYWFVPHGVGLHRELAEMVDAGFSPQEALAAATSVPADILGWSDMGYVAEGYRADLVVVTGHPDENIGATRNIVAVYQGGRVLDSADLWLAAGSGRMCLDDRDCAAGTCDLVDFVCRDSCRPAYDYDGSCDDQTWCRPVDGLSTTVDGACAPEAVCDLYAQDCQPASYELNCTPADIDSNTCFSSGPRRAGQSCSWSDPDYYCAVGNYCSSITWVCYELCDPDAASTCSAGRCNRQYTEASHPWFGLCY